MLVLRSFHGGFSPAIVAGFSALALSMTGCGGDSSTASSGSGGNGGSAKTAGSGGAGASNAGSGGGAAFEPQKCGDGLTCHQGERCSLYDVENATVCDCDPSGHYLCNRTGMQTIPAQGCSQNIACLPLGQGPGDPCTQDNGHCVLTCTCDGGCTFDDCQGPGPETPATGALCDEHYCDAGGGFGFGCWIKDGDCDYSVSCGGGDMPLNGSCPPGQ